jgi:hypothetical protein
VLVQPFLEGSPVDLKMEIAPEARVGICVDVERGAEVGAPEGAV